MSGQLNLDITMAELIDGWPGAALVLARRGLACVGCAMARFETVAEAAAAYGFDGDALLQEVQLAARSHSRRSNHVLPHPHPDARHARRSRRAVRHSRR